MNTHTHAHMRLCLCHLLNDTDMWNSVTLSLPDFPSHTRSHVIHCDSISASLFYLTHTRTNVNQCVLILLPSFDDFTIVTQKERKKKVYSKLVVIFFILFLTLILRFDSFFFSVSFDLLFAHSFYGAAGTTLLYETSIHHSQRKSPF